MIGLIDYDMLNPSFKTSLPPPNLHLMKLATYLFQQKYSVRMIADAQEDLAIYTKIFYFQNDSKLEIYKPIFRHPNVEWIGLAFTGGQPYYIPPEIDVLAPQIGIYKPLLRKLYLAEPRYQQMITNFLYGSYIDFESIRKMHGRDIQQHRRLYIYDNDFFREGYQERLDFIKRMNPSSMYFVQQQSIYRIDKFIEVLKYNIPVSGKQLQLIVHLNEHSYKALINGLSEVGGRFRHNYVLVARIGYPNWLSIISLMTFMREYLQTYRRRLPIVGAADVDDVHAAFIKSYIQWYTTTQYRDYGLTFIEFTKRRKCYQHILHFNKYNRHTRTLGKEILIEYRITKPQEKGGITT